MLFFDLQKVGRGVLHMVKPRFLVILLNWKNGEGLVPKGSTFKLPNLQLMIVGVFRTLEQSSFVSSIKLTPPTVTSHPGSAYGRFLR